MTERYKFPCGCEWPVIGPPPYAGALPLLDVDLELAPLDCKASWELLGRGLTKGVFQLESGLGRSWTKKLKPESGEHMAALGALLRPGCLRALDAEGVSTTERYVRRRHGEPFESYHPAVEEILRPTYAVLSFQEQAMAIARVVAGFTPIESNQLRKACGKKLPEEMAKVEKKFMEGAARVMVVPLEMARELFSWIKESQRYSFNKCVAGSERVRRPGGSKLTLTVAEMHRIRNDLAYAKATGHYELRKKWNRLGHYGMGLSLQEDARVRPNKIADIRPAGLQPVYRLTLEDGREVVATGSHKFPTWAGEMTVDEMRAADGVTHSLFVCGPYEKTDWGLYNFGGAKATTGERQGGAVKGCFGEANYAYSNGSWTAFEQNRVLLPPGCCVCGTEEGRLEVHHKSGDRTDSGLDNLERLCASCHKKREYAAGRAKAGEKGYPSVITKVVSIETAGEEETFDVEMGGPHHNFVTGSGIVTCNSHAVCYGLTGYECAYLKAHFPLAFFASFLKNSVFKRDPHQEAFELVNDARLFDVPVHGPDIRGMQEDVHIDNGGVRFGLACIKGVGRTHVARLKREASGKPLASWSWGDFLTGMRLPPSLAAKLVEAGAFAWSGVPRQRQLAELRAFAALTKKELEWLGPNGPFKSAVAALRALARPKKEGGGCSTPARLRAVLSQALLLESPPTPLVDSPHWVAFAEEQLLGIAVSCSKMDSCDVAEVNCSCKEFMAGRAGYLVLGVEIQEVRETRTRKGRTPGARMARMAVSDGSCAAEAVVFPEAYASYAHLLVEGNTVILQGERDRKGEYDSFIVNRAWQALQA